jgi:hypothetical protein
MPEYGIDLHHNEVYEGGATLIALLAYPTDDEGDLQRAPLQRSLCHLALRARAEDDDAWANTPQPLPSLQCGDCIRQAPRGARHFFRHHRQAPSTSRAEVWLVSIQRRSSTAASRSSLKAGDSFTR